MFRVSWSSYNSYNSCQLQFYLRYVRKVRVVKDQKPFLVGSTVHDAICEWARQGYPKNFVAQEAVRRFRELVKKISFADPKDADDKFKSVIKGALETERLYLLMKVREHGCIVEPRFTILVPGSGFAITGGYDLYDPVTRTVYDLKLYSKDTSGEGDRGQLLTYALALICDGKLVERAGFIYPLMKNKVVTFPVSEQMIDHHRRLLIEMVGDAQELNVFSEPQPTTGKHCMWCEYYRSNHCTAMVRLANPEKGKRSYLLDMRSMDNA